MSEKQVMPPQELVSLERTTHRAHRGKQQMTLHPHQVLRLIERAKATSCADLEQAVDAFNAWWKLLKSDDDPLLTDEPETVALNAWLSGWQHNTAPMNSKETHG